MSGALVTLLCLASPWFLYIHRHPEGAQAFEDLHNSVSGEGHYNGFWAYIPYLLSQAMPWTLLLVLAVVFVIRRWRNEPQLRVPAIWAACILLPLCVWGNKQAHYLLPLWPAMMLLLGGFADRAAAGRINAPFLTWFKRLWIATCFAIVLAALAVIPLGIKSRDDFMIVDAITALGLTLIVDTVWRRFRRRGMDGVIWPFTVAAVLLVMLVTGVWEPSLHDRNARVVAEQIRDDFGAAPCAYVAKSGLGLSLCFYLGGDVPELETAEERQAETDHHPALVLIAEYPRKGGPPSTPKGYRRYETSTKVYLVHPAMQPDDAFADRP
jgi:4-amino-4-deoxy-L-arabinose transferase-like glycosyltransferase